MTDLTAVGRVAISVDREINVSGHEVDEFRRNDRHLGAQAWELRQITSQIRNFARRQSS